MVPTPAPCVWVLAPVRSHTDFHCLEEAGETWSRDRAARVPLWRSHCQARSHTVDSHRQRLADGTYMYTTCELVSIGHVDEFSPQENGSWPVPTPAPCLWWVLAPVRSRVFCDGLKSSASPLDSSPDFITCTDFGLHPVHHSEPGEGIRNRACSHPRDSDLP